MSLYKKIIFSLFGIWCISLSSASFTFASGELADVGSQSINGKILLEAIMSRQDFVFPPSYKHINVLYTGVELGTESYDLLQKAIYLDVIVNRPKHLNLDRPLHPRSLHHFIKNLFGKKISLEVLSDIKHKDVDAIVDLIYSEASQDIIQPLIGDDTDAVEIFQDVYTKIRQNYLYSDDISDRQLIQGAIQGMAQATKDPYTVYFPPSEAQAFTESIQGEFFGIGAYIEMKEPGKLIIVSPIEGTPAKLSGLLPGDQVIQINDELVTELMDINTAVAKIKGPENTTVRLLILREGKEISKEIVRKKVIIEPLTLKELSSDKLLISISMFQFGLDNLFSQAMDEVSKKGYSTLVFDLRNNPGGSLEDVEHMLNYIVPTGERSVIIKTKQEELPYYSLGVPLGESITDKKIIILINKGSASASEIMAGVIKEYAKDVTIIGESSFGKGTVQSLRDYNDQSSIKITVAKWLMGKTKSSIDKIGVKPDKELKDNPETEIDEVLEYVKKLP